MKLTSHATQARPAVEHTGQHHNCNECNVAMSTWSRGYCQCREPIVEHLAIWETDQCGRCGREIRP
jgi:hypothetical protein